VSEAVDPTAGGAEPGGQRALLLDTDIFFAVKVSVALKHAGYTTRTVRQLDAFTAALATDTPTVALVNSATLGTDWPTAIRAARAAGVATVAYGSHVDVAAQRQAREAGATAVIANSKLAQDLPAVVARALRRNPPSGTDPSAGGVVSAEDGP
jgi:DNA-binding response OmpR family regulator